MAREVELQSSRESAANQLRGSVFSAIGEHVIPLLGEDDRKLALLAGLHTNFGALYDTRPVFDAFSRDIKGIGSRQELTRLAKRSARLQVESLRSEGGIETKVADLRVAYPTAGNLPEPFTIDDHMFHLRVVHVDRKYESEDSEGVGEEIRRYKDSNDAITDDVTDAVVVAFDEVDRDVEIEFELSYMDSPYVDNLSFFEGYETHHKLAFVLKEINTNEETGRYEIDIDAVHFPAGLIPTYRAELSSSGDDTHVEEEGTDDSP